MTIGELKRQPNYSDQQITNRLESITMPKVKCLTCGNKLHRSPNKVFRKNYCDQECRKLEKYSWFGFIYANRKCGSKIIADIIGIPVATLRTWICILNG